MGKENSITTELTRIIAAILNVELVNPTDRYAVINRPEILAVEIKLYCVLGLERDDSISVFVYLNEYNSFRAAVGESDKSDVLDRLITLIRTRINGAKRSLVFKVMG